MTFQAGQEVMVYLFSALSWRQGRITRRFDEKTWETMVVDDDGQAFFPHRTEDPRELRTIEHHAALTLLA